MSVSSAVNKVQYACDGAQVAFPFSYYFLADGDLKVTLLEISTGVKTVLTITTNYTVSGAGDAAGGTVTTVSTYSSSYRLTIERVVAATQGVDLAQGGSLPAETLERAYDRLTMLSGQAEEALGRAIKAPASDITPSMELPSAGQRANKSILFDANGDIGVGSAYTRLDTVRSVSTSGNILTSDGTLFASGTITLTLPTAVGYAGKEYRIINVGTGIITINCTGAQTINGAASKTLEYQYAAAHVIQDGVNNIMPLGVIE